MLHAAFLTDDRPVVPRSVTVAVLHEYTLRYSTNYVQELRGFGRSSLHPTVPDTRTVESRAL
jgi:hypothetical protein